MGRGFGFECHVMMTRSVFRPDVAGELGPIRFGSIQCEVDAILNLCIDLFFNGAQLVAGGETR